MFIIDKAYRIGPRGDDKMVVDYDRDVWMQRVTTIPNLDEGYGTELFSLVWKGRHVQFEARDKTGERVDLVGRPYEEWQITSLGGGKTFIIQPVAIRNGRIIRRTGVISAKQWNFTYRPAMRNTLPL